MSKLLSMMMEKQQLLGYTKYGSPTIIDGVLTSANASNHLRLANADLSDKDFELGCKFKCGINFTQQTNTITNAVIFPDCLFFIGYDGWMTGNGFNGELYLSDCYLKIENKLVFAGTPA